MSSENKYYYSRLKDTSYASGRSQELIKWNKNYYVELDEEVLKNIANHVMNGAPTAADWSSFQKPA